MTDVQAKNLSAAKTIDAPGERWVGYALGALGASLFATKGIVIKLALAENVDAVTTLTWRMIIAVPIFALIGWMGYRQRVARGNPPDISPRTLLAICAVGALGYYVASYLDFAGLTYISAQFDRLILLTSPFFVLLFGAILFRRRVTLAMIAALVASYLGLVVIFVHDLAFDARDVVRGTLLVLGAAIAYAGYQLLAKPLIDRTGSRFFTSLAMTSAGVAVVAHFLLTHNAGDLLLPPNAMLLMLAMGTVSTVLPAYLIAAAIGRIGSEPTSVMGNISPLVTIALAVTILGETFSIWHAVGAALVLGGVITFGRLSARAAARPG
ncbi:MAG TPA: DMT family transporter [Devosiaceae bacterium]